MKSVNQEVAHLINQDISLQKCLKRGIVNVRGLAHYLVKTFSLPYSLDAVISAVRRYDVDSISLLTMTEAQTAFARMSVSTKDNVAIIILKDKAFQKICEDFLAERMLKENARIVKSKETIKLIVSQKELDKKLSIFNKENIIEIRENVSELRLQFPQDASKIKGIIARVASELALRNINVENVIYSMPDVLLYVTEKNLVEAHKSLMEIKG